MTIDNLTALLQKLPEFYETHIDAWHRTAPPAQIDREPNLLNFVTGNLLLNYNLWHTEDEARRTDVPDARIATIKRNIDQYNQERNDMVELIDQLLLELLQKQPRYSDCCALNTETPGSAFDRLAILSLKMYHMSIEGMRSDVNDQHREKARQKHTIMQQQRKNLHRSLVELVDAYVAGEKTLRLYRQFKMYNDPSLNPALYAKL